MQSAFSFAVSSNFLAFQVNAKQKRTVLKENGGEKQEGSASHPSPPGFNASIYFLAGSLRSRSTGRTNSKGYKSNLLAAD